MGILVAIVTVLLGASLALNGFLWAKLRAERANVSELRARLSHAVRQALRLPPNDAASIEDHEARTARLTKPSQPTKASTTDK